MHIATNHTLRNSQASHRTLEVSLGDVAKWVAGVVHRWRERAAERRELAQMDDRALRDARLQRWEVEMELSRPFWRS